MRKSKILAIVFVICLVLLCGYIYAISATHRQEKIPFAPSIGTENSFNDKDCPNSLISWNLENFGKKKTDQSIELMAEILKGADIVTIQEVTAGGQFGAQAVAKLIDALSRKGSNWDYVLSDPAANGSPDVERAAILFKAHKVTTNRKSAHLMQENWSDSYGREPYTSFFQMKQGDQIRVTTLHAPPTAKNPVTVVQALTKISELQNNGRAIFTGDFNLGKSSTDPSFEALSYTGHISEPTSLKNKVTDGKYRVKQYDNIYTKGIHVCSSGVIDFVNTYYSPVTDESLKHAKEVSDHLPVYITFK